MLNDADLERYARQVIMPQVGEEGQQRLLDSRMLVVGAGGLGAPVMLYLAGAGVGAITIMDDDDVETSNLNRQIIHTTASVGTAKVAQAAAAATALNPGIDITQDRRRLDPSNAEEIIAAHDLVIDCTDKFATRLVISAAAHRNAKPHVFGGAVGALGQLAVFTSGKGTLGSVKKGGRRSASPCFSCVFPEAPDPKQSPGCEQAGILGPVTGLIGSLQALEAIKLVLGMGSGYDGRLLMFDGESCSFMEIEVKSRKDCENCGGD